MSLNFPLASANIRRIWGGSVEGGEKGLKSHGEYVLRKLPWTRVKTYDSSMVLSLQEC